MGAVFCDDPTPHGGHLLLDVDARCPGRGLPSEQPAVVCTDCGRDVHQPAPTACAEPYNHDQPEPAPEPALRGDDLVRFLNNDREALQQQVAYATQLLTALAQRTGGRLTVTMQELDAVEGMALQVWCNEAADALEYRVRER